MEQAIEAELRAAWERLSRRNRWTLVDDLEEFLREAAVVYAALNARMPPAVRADVAVTTVYQRRQAAHAEVAVLKTYGRRLYARLRAGDGRAAEELRIYFFWHALGKHWSQQDAEDIAGEATIRALMGLSALRSPEGIFLWRVRVFQSAQQVLIRQRRLEVPMPVTEEGEQLDLPDPQSLTEQAELRILATEFIDLLRTGKLSELDQEILIRSFVDEQQPREIAAALGLRVENVRVHKSRALQALRNDARFVELLRELAVLFKGKETVREGASDGK
jgi:RNA polymerase sigma factor (sigma-70 family)